MIAASPVPMAEARAVMRTQPQKLNRREALFRAAIVVVLLASLALAWWTFVQRLVPLQRQSRELTSRVGRLSTEVDSLERKWTPAQVEQIRASHKQAHSTLFADENALGAWLQHLEEQATPLALDFKLEFGKSTAQTNSPEKLAVIPATVSIDFQPALGTAESAYQRLLRLGRQLAAEGKRADLAELTAMGGANSVTRASLVFNLWAGEDASGPTAAGGAK